jgi:hypothetical protein
MKNLSNIMDLRTVCRWCGVLAAVGFLSIAIGLRADAAEPKGTTSKAARQEAVRSIPFDRLDADARRKATSVVNADSLFRRMPVETVACDPNLYLFLLRNPEVVVEIWHLMGVTDLKLTRTGAESFKVADNAGTTGNVEFLYGDQNTHVLYVEGQYRGSLYPRPITANCVLVMQSHYVRKPDGSYAITSKLDTFIDVKNIGVDLVAKTFQSVFGRTTDHNFVETAGFIGKLSDTAEENPGGVQRLAARLTGVDPQVREQFALAAAETGRRAEQRQAAMAQQRPTANVEPATVRGQGQMRR